jgi:hypothetical protein
MQTQRCRLWRLVSRNCFTHAHAAAAVMPCRSRRSAATYSPRFSFLIWRRSTPGATKSSPDSTSSSRDGVTAGRRLTSGTREPARANRAGDERRSPLPSHERTRQRRTRHLSRRASSQHHCMGIVAHGRRAVAGRRVADDCGKPLVTLRQQTIEEYANPLSKEWGFDRRMRRWFVRWRRRRRQPVIAVPRAVSPHGHTNCPAMRTACVCVRGKRNLPPGIAVAQRHAHGSNESARILSVHPP